MEVFDMLAPDLSVGNIDFDRLYKTLLGATFLFTAVISITASLVIGAQIYYLTAENPRARRRYTHIIEIIIQSSALYSLAIVCQAIETLINAVSSNEEIVLLDAEIYIGTITMFTTVCSLMFFHIVVLINYDNFIRQFHQLSWLLVCLWSMRMPRNGSRQISHMYGRRRP